MSHRKERFEAIYANEEWGHANGETRSGGGSTLEINKFRAKFLGSFIRDYKIRAVYDICGDANWQHTIDGLDRVRYYGCDISEAALAAAKRHNRGREHMVFSETSVDLCESTVDVAAEDRDHSLMIVKEVVQHLSLRDGVRMLDNIRRSGIRYVAITSHDQALFGVSENTNVDTGGFYPNNVFLPPFNFRHPLRDMNDVLPADLAGGYGNLLVFDLREQDFGEEGRAA